MMPDKSFRVIFMGTPEFASASLKALVNAGFHVVAVITAPDKPSGRGQKLHESDVKKCALDLKIPVLQPEKLKAPEFLQELKSYQADLQVVVAFRMLTEVVWSMPRIGTINLHASLLPHYRGAAPINHAIIKGETTTGVTTFFIEKEIDTGKIIFREEVPVLPDENAGSLHDKLMNTGARLLVKTVGAVEQGVYPQVSQKEFLMPGEEIKTAPKIFKEDCLINWSLNIRDVYNHIRGLSPYPAAWSVFIRKSTDERLSFKVFEALPEYSDHPLLPGQMVSDGKKELKVAVPGGYIHILSLQVEGKKRLSTEEFLKGFRLAEYTIS